MTKETTDEIKEIKKEITVFITQDGKEFATLSRAKMHNATLKKSIERKEFLSKKLTELIGSSFIKAQVTTLADTKKSAFCTANTKIFYQSRNPKKDSNWYEPDENMPIDMAKWDKIVYEMEIQYGFTPVVPGWYWGK